MSIMHRPDDWDILSIMDGYMNDVNKVYADSDTRNCDKWNAKEKLGEIYAQAIRILFNRGFGDIMTVDNFIKDVEEGYFIDYDGQGYFCDMEGEKHECITCDVDWLKENRKDYPFIIWYNR